MPTPTTYQAGQIMPAGSYTVTPTGGGASTVQNTSSGYFAPAPTVLSNSNIIENTIPNTVANTNQYLGTGTNNTNTTGTGTGTSTTESNPTLDYLLGEQTKANTATDTGYNADKAMLDSMKSAQDASFNQQLDQLTSFYSSQEASLRESQGQTSRGLGNLLETDGTNRTSDESGILSAKKTYDIQQLNQLHQEELRARAGLMAAKSTNDYQAMAKQLELAQKARKDKQDFADKIIQQNIEQQKVQREQKQKTLDDINKLSIDASKNGAPKDIIDKIINSKTLGEAVANAGEYMQSVSGSGIVAEYNYYKKDAIARGQVPLSFDEYQTRDANRKVSLAKAGTSATGLDNSTLTKVQGIANQLDSEAQVKAYQTSAEAIQAMQTAGKSPTDDISRIYAFAKVMDPNSVVREGEYKTVQDYSTALVQRMGLKAARVFTNTGFLTDEARNFMLKTLKNRLSASEGAYKNIHDEYARRINKITGATDGADYLTDYSKPFTSTKDEVLNKEEDAKSKVLEYGKSNPDFQIKAKPLLTEVQPELGRPMTYEEVMNLFNINP